MPDHFIKYKKIHSKLIYGDLSRKPAIVTFLIPTYKRPETIKRAVNSILNQKSSIEFDILAVDNEPDEDTETQHFFAEICKEHKNIFYYKNEKNIGMFPNWNRCYELARSKWCCILMSDDELKSNYLQRVTAVQKKYHFDCIRVGSDIYDQSGKHVPEYGSLDRRYHNRKGYVKKADKRYFIFRAALPPSGMFVKREAVIALGGYHADFFPSADYEFDSRLVLNYRVGMLWERLCVTYTADSTSMKKDVMFQSVSMGYRINDYVYRNYFRRNKLLLALNDIKTFIAINESGFSADDFQNLNLNKKYNNACFLFLYRVIFRVFRVAESCGL